jgi:mannosyltransferase
MKIWFHTISKLKTGIFLLLILLLAAALRLYGLQIQSLWNDELFSLWISSFGNLKEVFIEGILPDTHPPAYQVILYFVIKLFGDSESALRMPSAISGILAVWGTFLVGRLLYSEKEGLFGAAIMAVSWTPVYFSQEARSGMLMVFSTVFAVYFWLKILIRLQEEKKIPNKLSFAYFSFAVFSCYVHYFALFFIALQGLLSAIFFLGKWKKEKYILFLYLIIILAYLPWLPSFINQFSSSQGRISWISVPGPQKIVNLFLFIFGTSYRLLWAILFLVLIYFAYHIVRYNQKKVSPLNNQQRIGHTFPVAPDLLLVLWFVLPVAITYGISISFKPLFVARYLMFVLPAGYLLLARSIFGLPLKLIFKNILSVLLILYLLNNLIFTRGYYTTVLKEPFRTVAQYINDSHMENSIVITNDSLPLSFEYYFNKLGSNHRVDLKVVSWDSIILSEEVPKLIKENDAEFIWYINQKLLNFNDDVTRSYLDNSYVLVHHEEFKVKNSDQGFDVYLYRTNASSP